MGKIDAVKIEQGGNSYSESIPLGGFAEHITYNNAYSLLDILGTGFNLGPNTRGNIKQQLDTLFENNNLEVLEDQLNTSIAQTNSSIAQTNLNLAQTNLEVNLINQKLYYVTPQQYNAVGDGLEDDTNALQAALNSGFPVIASKKYRITQPIIIKGSYKSTPNSIIILDFDENGIENITSGVLLRGSRCSIDLIVNCNSLTFSLAAVALDGISRSNISIQGINCKGVFFTDGDKVNYNNYININGRGAIEKQLNEAGVEESTGNGFFNTVCALINQSENVYNQICCRDFQTCVQLSRSTVQNINYIHGCLTAESVINLWETSSLIKVINLTGSPSRPQLVFNLIKQDTMRYGFRVDDNSIEAYGSLWVESRNTQVATNALIGTKTPQSFYASDTAAISCIKCDYYHLNATPINNGVHYKLTSNNLNKLIFNGKVSPRGAWDGSYDDANTIPIGNVVVSLAAGAVNAPESGVEKTLLQFSSSTQTVQLLIVNNNNIYLRKKAQISNWEESANWLKIYPTINITYGTSDPDPNSGNVGDIYLKIIDV